MTSGKIVITGGRGFIGRHFAKRIATRYPHDQVVILDSNTYAADQQSTVAENIQYITADITNRDLMFTHLQHADYIYNFAAQTHIDRSIADPYPFIESNIVGIQTLIDAAIANKVKRFIQISTDEIYGDCSGDNLPADEDFPHRPGNPYSATKSAAEHLLQAAIRAHQLDAVVVRPSNNYGSYQFPEKIIPLFITNAILGKPLPVYGDGSALRDYLYVEDHCAAIELICDRGECGHAYNVGTESLKSGKEIATAILEILDLPQSMLTFVKDRPGHDYKYWMSIKKIRRLGWEPATDFYDGLEKTICWYQDNMAWWKTKRPDHQSDQTS